MKLFELVLYQSCNYRCPDCPMAQWIYEPDELDDNGTPRNGITNELLLEWLDKYLDPKEWFIEITGGEPGLYPEIKPLIPELTNRGYKGLIRTNGSQIIPRLPSFPLVSAWHKDKPFPEHRSYVMVLENPNEDYTEKSTYCEENNIPYCVFPYTNFGSDLKCSHRYPPNPSKIFTEMTTMFSSGAITGCFSGKADLIKGPSLQKMSPPAIFDLSICRTCCNIEAIEYFINDIKGFRRHCSIKDDPWLSSAQSLIKYPYLNAQSEWIDRDGYVVGVLGDDISEFMEGADALITGAKS